MGLLNVEVPAVDPAGLAGCQRGARSRCLARRRWTRCGWRMKEEVLGIILSVHKFGYHHPDKNKKNAKPNRAIIAIAVAGISPITPCLLLHRAHFRCWRSRHHCQPRGPTLTPSPDRRSPVRTGQDGSGIGPARRRPRHSRAGGGSPCRNRIWPSCTGQSDEYCLDCSRKRRSMRSERTQQE